MSNAKLTESLKIDTETYLGATVAGSSVSKLYDMRGYDNAALTFSMGLNAASIATCATVIVCLVESSHATVGGTTLIGGKAALTIGQSNNTAFTATCGITGMVLQSGSAASATAATTADAFRLGIGSNIVTFTFSSEATMTDPTGGNLAATVAYFGSSVAASTANTGGTALIDSIRTALKSTILCCGGPDVFRFSTPDTGSLMLEIQNPRATGSLFYSNTMATTRMLGQANQAACVYPVRSDQLTSTANKRYIGLRWTTLNQALPINVTVVRSKGRYMPGGFAGTESS